MTAHGGTGAGAWETAPVDADPWQVQEWHLTVPGRLASPPPRQTALHWPDDAKDVLWTALLAVLGAPLVGLLWSAIGPKLPLRSALGGAESAFRSEVGADVHFLFVTAAAGVVCALVALALRRDGPGVVVGLAVGGALGALVTDRVGYLVNHDHTLSVLRHLGVSLSLLDKYGIDPFFKVRAVGVILAWPLAAVLTHTLVVAIRDRRSLP